MTYSNINRDKRQSGQWKLVKQAFFYIFTSTVIASSFWNIWKQWSTIRHANNRVLLLEDKVKLQNLEIKKYTKLIEEATSSAITERKQREYFGIGGPNDRWLILPTITDNEKLNTEIKPIEEKPIIVQWWELFTK